MSTAHALLRQVEAAGGQLIPRGGDGLRVQAPAPLPDELVAELRQYKGELLSLLAGAADKLAPTWGAETARLIRWFRTTTPPAERFELQIGVTIVRPDVWWASIAANIEAGPRVGRGLTGALAGDLAKLYELFGQTSGEADEDDDPEREAIMAFDGRPSDGTAA